MGSPLDTHLYYSKVEIGFQNVESKDLASLDRRAKALFELVIIELEKSHWPKIGAESAGGIQAGLGRRRFGAEHMVGSATFLHPGRDRRLIAAPAILDQLQRSPRAAAIETSLPDAMRVLTGMSYVNHTTWLELAGVRQAREGNSLLEKRHNPWQRN